MSYVICPRREIPPRWFDDEDLIVERYIANRKNVFYRAFVMRNAIVVEAAISHLPLKKMNRGLARSSFYFRAPRRTPVKREEVLTNVRDLPRRLIPTISRLRRHIELDFGSIDVVADDEGNCYIVDVNTTPYWGRNEPEIVSFLRSSD